MKKSFYLLTSLLMASSAHALSERCALELDQKEAELTQIFSPYLETTKRVNSEINQIVDEYLPLREKAIAANKYYYMSQAQIHRSLRKELKQIKKRWEDPNLSVEQIKTLGKRMRYIEKALLNETGYYRDMREYLLKDTDYHLYLPPVGAALYQKFGTVSEFSIDSVNTPFKLPHYIPPYTLGWNDPVQFTLADKEILVHTRTVNRFYNVQASANLDQASGGVEYNFVWGHGDADVRIKSGELTIGENLSRRLKSFFTLYGSDRLQNNYVNIQSLIVDHEGKLKEIKTKVELSDLPARGSNYIVDTIWVRKAKSLRELAPYAVSEFCQLEMQRNRK